MTPDPRYQGGLPGGAGGLLPGAERHREPAEHGEQRAGQPLEPDQPGLQTGEPEPDLATADFTGIFSGARNVRRRTTSCGPSWG